MKSHEWITRDPLLFLLNLVKFKILVLVDWFDEVGLEDTITRAGQRGIVVCFFSFLLWGGEGLKGDEALFLRFLELCLVLFHPAIFIYY